MPYCFTYQLYYFTFPPTMHKSSNFSTSSATFFLVFCFWQQQKSFFFFFSLCLCYFIFLCSSSLNGYEMVYHCNFDLLLLLLNVLIGYIYIFFAEMTINILCQSFFLLLSCICSLCILDTTLSLDICFADIFSLSMSFLLTLLILSCEAPKF